MRSLALLLALTFPPLAAGAAAQVAPSTGSDTVAVSPTDAGLLAARGRGTMPWLLTGVLGGALAGPLGAGVNFALASHRPAEVPPEARAAVADRDVGYREAFAEAYRHRLRSDRRTAALVGGGAGSVVFAVVLWQLGSRASSRTGGGSRTPPVETP